MLKSIFSNLGFGEITAEDLKILIETADVDGDGRISLGVSTACHVDGLSCHDAITRDAINSGSLLFDEGDVPLVQTIFATCLRTTRKSSMRLR